MAKRRILVALILSGGLAAALPAAADSPAGRACVAYSASHEASGLPASFPDTGAGDLLLLLRLHALLLGFRALNPGQNGED